MKKKTSFLLVMLIAFILIILIFIGYFYYQTVRTNQTNLENIAKNQLTYATQHLSAGQKTIEENASTILIDQTVKNLREKTNAKNELDYLEELLKVKSILKERLINTPEIASIFIYWPQSDIFISTETDLNMKDELKKPLKTGKEWRSTEKGLYFFMNYSFGHIKDNEIIISVKMSDALLLATQETMTLNLNNTAIILPNEQILGGSKQMQLDIKNKEASFEKKAKADFNLSTNHSEKWVIATLPDSNVTIAMILPQSMNEESYARHTIFIVISIIFILIFSCLFIFLYYRNIVSELALFTTSMKKVEQGNYNTRIIHQHNNEFGYLFEQFNQMVASIQKLLQSLSKEMKQRELAEVRQFQSQIQPHFLYNSLFYIVSVADDSKAVMEMTRHLVNYYRYLTKKSDIVTLGEEIAFSHHYLSIQSLRKDIDFQIAMDRHVNDIAILPLLIQPIIENAIVHGIEEKDGAHQIKLTVQVDSSFCTILVEDDGPGLSNEKIIALQGSINLESRKEANDSVGLWNINQRLINYYGHTAKLQFSNSSLGGLLVSFSFNLTEGINHNETIDC